MRHSAWPTGSERGPDGVRPRRGAPSRAGAALLVVLLVVAVGACAQARDRDAAGTDPPASLAPAPSGTPDHAIAVFEVEGGERFSVELVGATLVANAEALLDGEDVPSIPVGTVVRGAPGPNAPWTWHLDPATVTFADQTIDGCDGDPSDVEAADDGSLPRYCPWSATVVAVDALP